MLTRNPTSQAKLLSLLPAPSPSPPPNTLPPEVRKPQVSKHYSWEHSWVSRSWKQPLPLRSSEERDQRLGHIQVKVPTRGFPAHNLLVLK